MTLIPEIASLVDEFNLGPLTVERRGPKTKTKFGDFETPAPDVFEIDPVSAHNVTGRDLDQVPEADRNSEVVQFYARDRSWPAGKEKGFRVADKGKLPDVVLYNGRRYRIATVRDFSTQGRVWCGFGVLEDLQAKA